MSSFKKLSKADVTVVPYNANKQWNLSFDCFPTSSDYLTIYKGTNVPGLFSLSDPINNGQYERLIYSEINHMFYQAYSGSLNTGSLMFNINTYQSASQQRPTASYFDYNNNANLITAFPTGSNEGIRVVAINQKIYGNKVLPNYFILSSSAYYITDDGYGNLYNGTTHIGNLFYAHGLVVITNQDYQLMFPTSSASCSPTTTTTSTTTSTTTLPTTTSTTTSTTTVPTTTSTTTSTTTVPTTTTSTTTSTTTVPTTTTSTTTSTTTVPTTTSTTTSTTTVPTTTTSTTTSTTTVPTTTTSTTTSTTTVPTTTTSTTTSTTTVPTTTSTTTSTTTAPTYYYYTGNYWVDCAGVTATGVVIRSTATLTGTWTRVTGTYSGYFFLTGIDPGTSYTYESDNSNGSSCGY
jgi:hypothetical protein